MTFSQKLYQSNKLEIGEECAQALEANYLEQIKIFFDKMFELDAAVED